MRPIDHRTAELVGLIAEFADRYTNAKTQRHMTTRLHHLFRMSGKHHPADLTEADLIQWCAGTQANNTVRGRISTCRTFMAYCLRRGLISIDPSLELDRLKKQYPKTYGKVQHAHPARWLTYDEAFGSLVGACQDGTWVGSRDQLAIRLGLMGVRQGEACSLTWGNLRTDGRLVWIGKGRRTRTVTPGDTFLSLLDRWRRQYERQIGRPVTADEPILCAQVTGVRRAGQPPRIAWGKPLHWKGYYALVLGRSDRAGLGHVAPHDLRRSAAGILHNTRTADGGHVYDLLDIQQVLDHADPATTQRSYLSPMASEVKKAAGATLD